MANTSIDSDTVVRPLLSLRNVSTEFETPKGLLRAVQDVSLDVLPGECVGIVGESGSGKSVTFASVMGLIRAPGRVSGGQVLFDGMDLRQLTPVGMRAVRGKQIAMTMQDALTALNPALNVERQLTEVILVHDDEVASLPRWQRQREARGRAIEMMSLVGIPSPETRLQDYPHQFSGGMRQRIMIAIALACKPRLLIADEPTTALDVTIQAQVLELIAGLRQRLGMSVVLITHDLGVVAEQCDRVVVMYAGQVVESGRTAEVIRAPKHPYTQGLLMATPRVENLSAPVRPIPGTVPNLINFPTQCHFYSRCTLRGEACLREIPLEYHPGRHQARCIKTTES
ncbi:MAG: ABC transporter ATP-binding protein [Gammaproteobacteria bacterium]|nr:ABC transporter ATP-binding protein [Gammaproteobacteria bacterium]MBU4324473.1 ABC transporter ATP-binding protein [Gammaproteobacteria bacterium]